MSKIVMVTDQPFWRASNGAHQRILSIANYLSSVGFELIIFYMIERSAEDVRDCDTFEWRFVNYDPAGGWLPKVVDALRPRRRSPKGESIESQEASKSNPSLTLEDYRWPHAGDQFAKLIQKEKPTAVLIEYVTWGNLLEALDADCPTRTVVDTHDALHRRNEQFRQHGKSHWLDISREEESRELQRFDLVLAIQQQESELFRELAPEAEHMVVGHVPWTGDLAVRRESAADSEGSRTVRLGFIGSDNDANVDGLAWFVRECWSTICQQAKRPIQLIVGGPIQNSLNKILGAEKNSKADSDQIEFVGHVTTLADFYLPLDIVINPVRFGSGLKIKTVEAFCFGKPLVSARHSTAGLTPETLEAIHICDTAHDFAAACLNLVDDSSARERSAARSRKIGETVFSPKSVYSDLENWLKNPSRTRKP